VHTHTVNYLTDDPNRRGYLLNRGFWLNDLPRVILLCRLFGHRPVVDGTNGITQRRWVTCSRCGIRPQPQGSLDPDTWAIGQRYTSVVADKPYEPNMNQVHGHHRPGPWPKSPTGTIGGQLVLGRKATTGATLTIGAAGADHVVATSVGIGGLFHLYLHTETHGTWLQRRLVPTGYESRVSRVTVHSGKLWTELWARENTWSKSDPWWMHGAIRLNPLDVLFGERRYTYEDVGDPVTATVRMPEGDSHEVTLQLRRRIHGRRHGRQKKAWTVDWASSVGIPVRNDSWKGDNTLASGVDVPDRDVYSGCWPAIAASLIAVDCSRDRRRYSYRPEPADAGRAV
jgi:hypothetical protein